MNGLTFEPAGEDQYLEDAYRGRMDAIELGVHSTNAGAIKLYARYGYETVQILDDLGFHIMQRSLADRALSIEGG